MQDNSSQPPLPSRPEGSGPNITSAVGLEETAGHKRARRTSLFTKTIIWVTGLICLAFLLGALGQAWSNSQLMQRMQDAQLHLQQVQHHHDELVQLANHYKDPLVIESEAREQLGYIRPGEHPVVISSSPDQGQQNAPQQSNTSPQQGFWQEWWNIFFGN